MIKISGKNLDSKGIQSILDQVNDSLNTNCTIEYTVHLNHQSAEEFNVEIQRLLKIESSQNQKLIAFKFYILISSAPDGLEQLKDATIPANVNYYILPYPIGNLKEGEKIDESLAQSFKCFIDSAINIKPRSEHEFHDQIESLIDKYLNPPPQQIEQSVGSFLLKEALLNRDEPFKYDFSGDLISKWELSREKINHTFVVPSIQSLINREQFKDLCKEKKFTDQRFTELSKNLNDIANRIRELLEDAIPFSIKDSHLAILYDLKIAVKHSLDENLSKRIQEYLDKELPIYVEMANKLDIQQRIDDVNDALEKLETITSLLKNDPKKIKDGIQFHVELMQSSQNLYDSLSTLKNIPVITN